MNPERQVALFGLNKTKRRTISAAAEKEITLTRDEEYVLESEDGVREVGRLLKRGAESENSFPGWKVLRQATEEDLSKKEANDSEMEETVEKAQSLVDKQGLPMNIIGGEYSLERAQLRFYFKAPHRVDFRGLLKELARDFSTRIELEQVGPREAAAILGGIGRCGYEFCCRRFLDDPGPIPMELASDQELSLSPERLTGGCGRLLCCLEYEHDDYVAKLAQMPDIGAKVSCPEGTCEVIDHNVQKNTVRLQTEEGEELELKKEEIRKLE